MPGPRDWSLNLASALTPALVVFAFDQIEAAAQQIGIDGGPGALAFVALVFCLAWAPAVVALARWSRRPTRQGVMAGLLVAACMALVLLRIALAFDDWLVLVLLPFFGAWP